MGWWILLAAIAPPPGLPAPSTPAPADSAYSPVSPHWRHIHVLDFGREVKYLPYGATRAAGDEWYARHVDAMEVGKSTFVNAYPGAQAAQMRERNPGLRTFAYDYDLTACQHQGCVADGAINRAEADLPEDHYLHFATDTRLRFVDLQGRTVDTLSIPGCPAPRPPSRASRVQVWIWKDARWVFNPKSAAWRRWYADHLLRELDGDPASPADSVGGLCLDEHGPGFANALGIGVHTIVLSGGAIREYGGRVPRSARAGGYDELDRVYDGDVVSWLTYLHQRFDAGGRTLRINIGEYFLDSLGLAQALAAGGATTERLHGATRLRRGAAQYRELIAGVRRMVAAGATVDLNCAVCDSGPPQFPPGNYKSGAERYRMWNLASYYLLKERAGDRGIVYFDPNLCIRADSRAPLSFEDEWLKAYEVDVGQPRDSTAAWPAGPAPIFARRYDRARVLLRAPDTGADSGDATAWPVPLDRPMLLLRGDGSLAAPADTVRLRSAEGVILF